jgi:hypothetical protein
MVRHVMKNRRLHLGTHLRYPQHCSRHQDATDTFVKRLDAIPAREGFVGAAITPAF